MAKLKYIVEDETLASILGVQNFTNKESAILELVKNAYDAYATEVIITFNSNKIIVEDNGYGFSYSDIEKKWMHVGKSDRAFFNEGDRIAAGSKGIGRFALARLGENIELYSRKVNTTQSIIWTTDWKTSDIEYTETFDRQGTLINIINLRDHWNNAQVEKLMVFLSRAYNDESMKITLKTNDLKYDVHKYFDIYNLGVNCVSSIEIKYNSDDGILTCNIFSDEFKNEAKYICSKDINFYSKQIKIRDYFTDFSNDFITKEGFQNALKLLGSFNGCLYFSLSEKYSPDTDKFLYKYKNLSGRYKDGITLYRNAFSISSYEGSKDWLMLGKRVRLSPAAASHPTGSWRVRENQLSGYIEIDKFINSELKDLSNRQGFDENIFYQIFVRIIQTAISEFERYRQSLIREIIEITSPKVVKEVDLINQVINNPEILKKFDDEKRNAFVEQFSEFKKESDNAKQGHKEIEERFRYDVRILNLLSTLGLKASSIAHELSNDRSSIENNISYIIERLRELKLWEVVSNPLNTEYTSDNIPELLKQNQDINTKMISFIDTMLYKIEKKQFERLYQDINPIITKIVHGWKSEYAWINFELKLNDNNFCIISSDTLNVIFDNLILNSIQQNNNRNNLIIVITIESIDGIINVKYQDNGRGLNAKYLDDPFKILEVHETSRENGHGLGMWILNSTLSSLDGNVTYVGNDNGFKIEFTIGGKI